MTVNWRGPWSSTASYTITSGVPDGTYHQGQFWSAVVPSTGQEPVTGSTVWAQTVLSQKYTGPYTGAAAQAGDVVRDVSTLFMCIASASGGITSDPAVDTASWLPITSLATDTAPGGTPGAIGANSGQGAVFTSMLFANGLVPGAVGATDGVTVFCMGAASVTDQKRCFAVWEALTTTAHNGVTIINPWNGINTNAGRWRLHLFNQLAPYTFAAGAGVIPSATLVKGLMVQVTDRSNIPVYSDGTSWRKFSDNSVLT